MRCSVVRIAAVIALLGVTAGTAWAFPPANPYSPSVAELQSQIDRTLDFSGNSQASTGVKTVAQNGVWWDITWHLGE